MAALVLLRGELAAGRHGTALAAGILADRDSGDRLDLGDELAVAAPVAEDLMAGVEELFVLQDAEVLRLAAVRTGDAIDGAAERARELLLGHGVSFAM